MNRLGDLANLPLDLALPARCQLCDHPASPALDRQLCSSCASGWREVMPSCPVCGRPAGDEAGAAAPPGLAAPGPPGAPCAACANTSRAYGTARAAFFYEDKVAEAIRALKYRRKTGLAPLLGRAMAHRLPALLPDARYTCVVPVPLHWTRFWSRGFNQAELIALPVARALGIPISEAVYRKRATRKQARLGKTDRQDNLVHAFAVRPRARRTLEDAVVLVIDDVYTTGATTNACATVLRDAGVRRVDVYTLARTP